jgi:hypothetical protein
MSVRRVLGASALAVIAPLVFVAGSAQAVTTEPSTISASPSDWTPASGQTFTVKGLFMAQGSPADHFVVKIQSATDDGHWAIISGAKMHTTSTGTYQMRLILQAKGVRELRAVGVVPGPAQDAVKRFTVTVH